MTVDTGDDEASRSQSQSPDDSGDQRSGDMGELSDLNGKPVVQPHAATGKSKSASNAKDPSRPRRKKARRACYACQRAHLTCGDERPCQRCIKRGLQDACHDGVRKKAKYLHDAPNDALMPGIGLRSGGSSHFQYLTSLSRGQPLPPEVGFPGSSPNDAYAHQQAAPSAFAVYPASGPRNQMPPPASDGLMSSQPFSTQPSPISPHFSVGPQVSPMRNVVNPLQQTAPRIPAAMPDTFGGNPFDANEAMQYNFDPASFNFGNHYGALEFGMLGHMSSGAAETPPGDNPAQFNPSTGPSYTTPISTGYSSSPVSGPSYFLPDQVLSEWPSNAQPNIRQASGPNLYGAHDRGHESINGLAKQETLHAYAIGAGSSSLTSSSSTSSPQPIIPGFEDSPAAATMYPGTTLRHGIQDRSVQQQRPLPSAITTPKLQAQGPPPTRRIRDASMIYETVKQPYPYTSAFHGLTAFLQRRFSPQKTLRIAKALASIRPSFISSTKDLNREDLIFMEKCFQRTLWEYEDFINACGTPTIVCRRTGEVAAVGKEFSILTGWKKDVLLGKEPNLNVNTGGTSGNPGTGASSRGGFNTPRLPDGGKSEFGGGSRPQPVYLAELLDDESAVDFYEDFARLAFGDSRGSVTTQCKLLKYKTTNVPAIAAEAEEGFGAEVGSRLKLKHHGQKYGKGGIGGEAGMFQLGEKDGKVACSYCWTVKRDVFDIPMLIVMNFLPCI